MNGVSSFNIVGTVLFTNDNTIGVSVEQNYKKDDDWVNKSSFFFVTGFGNITQAFDRISKFDVVQVEGDIVTQGEGDDYKVYFNARSVKNLTKMVEQKNKAKDGSSGSKPAKKNKKKSPDFDDDLWE